MDGTGPQMIIEVALQDEGGGSQINQGPHVKYMTFEEGKIASN